MGYDTIVKKLRRIRSKIYKYYLIDGINRIIIIGSILVTLLLLENAFLSVPPIGVAISIGIVAVIVLLYFIRFIIYPMTRKFSIEDIALLVEHEYPLFNDSLISTIQFVKSKDYVSRSDQMSNHVIDETIKTAQNIDFDDVIKPQKLNITGFMAVGFSLLLTAMVYFSLNLPKERGIAFRLDFPDKISKYNINWYRETAEDKNYKEELTIGEGSDVLIRAIPSAYKMDREFEILDYDVPEIHFRNTKNNVLKKFRMSLGFDEKGRKIYEYVENRASLGDWEVYVVWEKRNSFKYLFNVRPAPNVIESEIRYKAPDHMRPSEIVIESETVESQEVKAQIDSLTGEGYTVTLPKRNQDGDIIFNQKGKPDMSDVRQYKDDLAFETDLPELYEKYVRGHTEKWSNTINEIESTEVTMRLKLNKELDLQNSKFYISLKKSIENNTSTKDYEIKKIETEDTDGSFMYQVDFTLELAMIKYWFDLVDKEHLHQNERKSYIINVQSDQRPFAKFVYTGSSLRDRSASDRLVTPTGFIPLVIEAHDDFGINDIRLLYTVNGMTKKQRELFDDERSRKKDAINELIKKLGSTEDEKTKATRDLINFGDLALPDIKKALEETKNADKRLLLSLIHKQITQKTVNDFSNTVIFTDQPTNPDNIKFTVQVEKLLSEEILTSITDDSSMSLTFVIEVEDNRKSLVKDLVNGKLADVNRGQIFRSEPLTVSLVTLRTLQREIRTIMRKIVKTKIDELIFKQIALLNATDIFYKDPTALKLNPATKRGGIAFSTIFVDEVVRKDAQGDEIRYDGQAIGRMQDEISRIADGLVYRLDSIVRHYKNNLDLEKGEEGTPQQNTVQRIKIFLNLISLNKDIAFKINPELKKLENDQSKINWILQLMLNEETGLEMVLPSFNTIDLAQTMISMEINRASISREAALTYEEVISPDNIDNFERVRALLDKAEKLQTKTLDVLEECNDLMKIWDEFEEHKQEIEKLLKIQEDILRNLEKLSK